MNRFTVERFGTLSIKLSRSARTSRWVSMATGFDISAGVRW